VALREWRACRRVTHATIGLALAILVSAVLLLTYGNYEGEEAAKAGTPQPAEQTQ
jgi:hypothetical protein